MLRSKLLKFCVLKNGDDSYLPKDLDCKGVTPFSFGQQGLDDVATIKDLFHQLVQATMLMLADVSKLAKMSLSVPETTANFIQNLKSFGNLLYALLTSTSPHFK